MQTSVLHQSASTRITFGLGIRIRRIPGPEHEQHMRKHPVHTSTLKKLLEEKQARTSTNYWIKNSMFSTHSLNKALKTRLFTSNIQKALENNGFASVFEIPGWCWGSEKPDKSIQRAQKRLRKAKNSTSDWPRNAKRAKLGAAGRHKEAPEEAQSLPSGIEELEDAYIWRPGPAQRIKDS